MKYCLSVLLNKSNFDLAIVSEKHNIVKKRVCEYNKHTDVASSIFAAYSKEFKDYKVSYIGIGIANNIEFNGEVIYDLQGAGRYNVVTALNKLFKKDVYVLDDASLAGLTLSYKEESRSLLYLIFDSKVSNSFIIDNEIVALEDDINIKKSINSDKLVRSYIRKECVKRGLDDEFVCAYFFSNNESSKEVIYNWCKLVSEEISRLTKVLKVNDIAFSGYLGSYYDDFKDYLKIGKNIKCHAINNHKENTLIGVSHLMFKDNG